VARLTLFLDDGGVMNDNAVRGPQWQQLVAEFFVPRLGGSPAAWVSANHTVASQLDITQIIAIWEGSGGSYAEFDRRYMRAWLGGMCELLGISSPDPEGVPELCHEAERFITARVRSDFPGAAGAVRWLHGQGYALHTASGEPSWHLHNYLTGMGVRECFGKLYGPDLLDWFKAGPEYYERLLADAGIAAANAIFVDDNPGPIAWATQAGARTVFVGDAARSPAEAALVIPRLADLPGALARLG
jgi:phosphoglycolate phosphatase-like HAD superfamily hydrolase